VALASDEKACNVVFVLWNLYAFVLDGVHQLGRRY